MLDPSALQTIFERIEAGECLNQRELQILREAVQLRQITIATGDSAVGIGGSADGAVIVTGDSNIIITGSNAEAIRDLMRKSPHHKEAKPYNSIIEIHGLINEQSQAARPVLNPRILERIDRSVVTNKYLPAIARGVSGKLERTIPLIAPAGYGKSTILGHIYDALSQNKESWVGLILCSQLILGDFPLLIALGLALSQTEKPVTEIAVQLNGACGRGVLLVDTLDLILSPKIVNELVPILRTLMQQGTTVVFTCRDHEYSEFLNRDKLASISEQVDHHRVPEFNSSEIRHAAIQFFTHNLGTTAERGQQFAEAILNLSADSRSLLEIIQNPLLLALLCDLFGREGNVPPDLTISKLYQRYWQEKVVYSRADSSRRSKLALAKEKFCLTIAQSMFERSTTNLVEFFFLDELPIDLTDSNTAAYGDLLSEGVLEEILPTNRTHFFHQTLLEYAIAYWLTRHYAQAQRTPWLTQLASTDNLWQQSHWYPILRQHLAIVEPESAFTELATQLGTKNLGTFGAIAYAAAARQQPDALNHLLPLALSLGNAYQERLCQALSSAPKHLILGSWDTWLHLLAAANHTTAINTADTLSQSIARWWEVLEERLPEAINAVAARASTLHNGKDDRALVMGWLLQECLPLVAKEPSQSILAALRQHYFLAGHRMSVQILQIHQHLTVPRTDRAELLNILQQREIPNDTSLESAIIAFAVDFLKPLKTSDWLAFLDRAFPKRWNKIQATAVGQLAAACPDTLQILFERVLAPPQQTGEQLSRTFAALEAAVIAGATGSVTAFFTGLNFSSLLPATCKSLLNFLYRIVPLLSPQQQDEIARQLQISIPDELQETVLRLLDRLADKSAVARQLLESSLECLAPALQTQYRLRLLRFEPIAQHPPLDTLDKDTQMLLLQHYRVLDLPEAVERLLQASLLKREHVALAASKDWDEQQLKYLNILRVIPLLAATYPGIQARTLHWILQLWKNGEPLDIKTLSQICQTITYAANPEIARSLWELVGTWVQEHRQTPVGVVEVLGHSLETMIQQKQFDGAPAKPMIKALKAIAQSEEPTLDTEKLYYWVCQLLTTINLIKIPHSEPEVIDLLSAITRLKACYLCRLTDELLPVFAEKKWRRNLSAILRTIRRIEGVESSLFQKITKAPWYNEFVESILLEVRGL